jgi:hypothetical protein
LAFSKIYVLYPRGVRTGGPEALHQLVSTLRKLGQDAYLVPLPGTEGNSRVEAYRVYDAPEAPAVVDHAHNAVIAPEHDIARLRSFKSATRFCWWLSIDNAPPFKEERQREVLWPSERTPATSQVRLRAKGIARRGRSLWLRESVDFASIHHLTQSTYAWSYLFAKKNVLGAMVSDYTPLGRFEGVSQPMSGRSRLVAYNPKKAARITRLLSSTLPEVRFVAIENMSVEQVIDTLASSTIYLDLGYHPGKDRMPREAALCGAVTLAVRRGSAAFYQDLPIPREHKISPNGTVIEDARRAILAVLDDPDTALNAQDPYRARILGEQANFEREVSDVFVDGIFESDGSNTGL